MRIVVYRILSVLVREGSYYRLTLGFEVVIDIPPASKVEDAHSNGNINNDLDINKNILRNIDIDCKSMNIKNSVVCDKSTHVKYNTNIDIEINN